MSNAPTLAMLTLLAVAACVPAAGAQTAAPGISNPAVSAPTKLYFHVGTNQDFPINTQMPALDYTADSGFGIANSSLSCLPQNDATKGQTDKRLTTYYGWSSPGYVEYNFTNGDGQPRIHPERGLSFDVDLDPAVTPYIYWYITTFTGSRGENSVDPVIPNVVARATIRGGETITLNDEGYNSGPIIAQGSTDPMTLAGAATPSMPGYDDQQLTVEPGTPPADATVYGFRIPLKYQMHTIPKDLGYSVRIDLFVQSGTPGCEDPDKGYLMPNFVNTRTDRDHRPRIELAILNAVRIEYMHPQFVGDDLVIHTSENSPWGNYDVDETAGGIELAIAGPNGPVNGVYRAAVVQRTHEHDHHTQAVDVTYVWPYHGSKEGVYTITLEVKNDQGSAVAKGVAQFGVGKDGKQGVITACGGQAPNPDAQVKGGCFVVQPSATRTSSPVLGVPGPGAVGLLGLLGLSAVVLRRRA